jgi:methyl-accepting chemotaxis protein
MAVKHHTGGTFMDDQTNRPGERDDTLDYKPADAADAAPAADEPFGWTGKEPETPGQGAGAAADRMLTQLQSMIDSIATQAAPVVRQIGAKAAELAAAAADRAGPIAHRAADATADASGRIAERSRTIAADLRQAAGGSEKTTIGSGTGTAVIDEIDDATEQASRDDPAEGAR